MSCCKKGITKVELEFPIVYTNFVSYPTTCRRLGLLATHDFAEVVFPAQADVKGKKLPVSILECTTNTPVFDSNGKPVYPTDIEPNRPYGVYFCPVAGGYVLKGLTCADEVTSLVKGVDKK